VEDLFSTNITVNNQNFNYQVGFEKDQYVFSSETNNEGFSSFSFIREHDEWHEQNVLPEEIKKQAVDALEVYLMKQH
jgi:hypothetical protein